MKQIRQAIDAELAKMAPATRRIVFVVTALLTVVFGSFTLFILWALAVGSIRFDAVAITLPIVVICALWFGFIAAVARSSRK